MSDWKLEQRSRRSRSRWMNAMMRAGAALLVVSAMACRDGGPADGGEPTDPAAETALYVDAARGADANPGTRDAPFATIAAAIQRVSPGREIRVAGGVYPQTLTLRSGLRVIGGWDGTTWRRSNVPTFVGAGSVAVTGSNVSDIVLDGLIIQSADVTEPGATSTAMLLTDVSGFTLRASRVMAGRGAPGRNGADGANGSPGGRGANGRTPVACFPGVTIAGGSGASSSFAAGGSGGYGSTVDGGNGARGGGADAGAIGQGGDRVGGIGRNGRDGGPGTTGTPGDDGRGGEAFGTWANGAYQPANGANGTNGTNGSGGGGGGGGAGAGAACGASGSGGGAGGSRGALGTAGQGGGGSFGLIVSGTATLDGVEIVTAGGGDGGDGGRGGAGGAGGQGGSRRAGTSVLGSSGAGGIGGRGGTGGHGGGGGGGPSIGILELNGAQVTTTAVTFSLGEGGASGRGPGNAGQPGLRAERRAN